MTNLNNRLLFINARSCLNTCSAEKFSEILSEYNTNSNSGFGFGNSISYDPLSYISVSDILTVYAARFPKQFLSESISYDIENILLTTAQLAIEKDDPAALTLLKKAISCGLQLRGMSASGNFKEIVTAAAIMRNTECLEYCREQLSDFSENIQIELVCFLLDNSMDDILDFLLSDLTREQIAKIFTNNICLEFNMITLNRPLVEYIYDICTAYIPEIHYAENVPAAVSEFMNSLEQQNGQSVSLLQRRLFCMAAFSDNAKEELLAMKRLGLYFTDISDIIFRINMNASFVTEDSSNELIKEYFLPVLGEHLNLRLLHTIPFYTDSEIRSEYIRRIEIIGKERISFDLRSSALEGELFLINQFIPQIKKHTPRFFRSLLNSGIRFITDDDLSQGCAADIITQIPVLLSAMLDQGTFNRTQINELVGKASSTRRTDALNILNKYIIKNRK